MFYDFESKVAFVTGGTEGIGFATAKAFADNGASVAILGRDPAKGQKAEQTIGPRCRFFQADVSIPQQLIATIERTVEHFGRLDFAFNNVARSFSGPLVPITEEPLENFDVFFDTNVRSMFVGMRAQIPAMLSTAGRGAIVNMTTIAGLTAHRHVPNLYGASKHAVTGITRNAARDWAPKGIRINLVAAGVIDTEAGIRRTGAGRAKLLPETPIGRFGKPEEVAEAVLWLCSDRSAFTVGSVLCVDGGFGLQ